MNSNSKVFPEDRIKIARAVFEGEKSNSEAARELGVADSTIRKWVYMYREHGASAFLDTGKNKVYSDELRLKAVRAYLDGEGSLRQIAAKFGLRSPVQLERWIKMYNEGRDFVHKMSGGSRMTTSRKTTKDERLKIVKDCLESGKNYGEIAIKYNVSYQQVYQWTNKFIELGEAGLEDRRGKRKADQEPRTELEEMKIKMAQLEHELYMTKMERDLLKKLDEVERRDASHK